jgi:hypothetical protein
MAAKLTIRPLDAEGRLLPTAGRIVLMLDGVSRGDEDCGPGQAVSFEGLPMHRVYAAHVSAAGFGTSTKLIGLAASDRTDGVLCFLSKKQSVPLFPVFHSLDHSLRAVLDRSKRLDRGEIGHDVPARSEPERRAIAAWPDPARSIEERQPCAQRDGERRWTKLRPEQKAGLLNLFAKMASIVLPDENTVWWHVIELDRIDPDRVFAIVKPTLAPKARATRRFKKADDSLHEPLMGFARAGSVKTEEPFGNLQLTFSTDGRSVMVDADVDEAAGIEHGEQVLRNWINSGVRKVLAGVVDDLPDGKTHPYDVHQILVFHQGGEDLELPTIRPYRACYKLTLRDGPPGYAIG